MNLRLLLDSNSDAMCFLDRDLRLLAYNRSFLLLFFRLFHVRIDEGQDLVEQIPREARGLWRERCQRALSGKSFSLEEQYRVDGRSWYFEIFLTPVDVPDQGTRGVSIVAHDITERYYGELRTTRLAGRLQTLLESAVRLNSSIRQPQQIYQDTMALLAESVYFDTGSVQLLEDHHLRVVQVWGFSRPEKVVGLQFPLDRRFPNVFVLEEQTPVAVEDIQSQYPFFLTEEGRYESAHIRSWLGVPLIQEGRVVGIFTMDRSRVAPFSQGDIQVATALAHNAAVAIVNSQLYQQLLAANETQQVLLRELHHRVKNNMQLVSSLMSLHAEDLHEDAQEVLSSLRTRILALSAVHESLYNSELLDRVNLVSYADQVMQEVETGYYREERKLSFHLEGPPALECLLDRAVPFGLIVSELVLNAVKHAFPSGQGGVIKVSLAAATATSVRVTISDNGVGFTSRSAPGDGSAGGFGDDPGRRRRNSFGMTLVESLCSQLKGSLQREPVQGGGTSWVLEFATGLVCSGEDSSGEDSESRSDT
ncbi:PAS domain S-box-containing protein [Alkalispirochaeta americana]|uniref:histidine kinase n=1 Tax=Alkalispirochaeta americana TaxID=159291 RepID=A0A1N6QT56_9SPIO|nr:histidine kinase dimerization/phosphoacceptor domain -containing protein [Alkalispirochaeta americana]SIQ19692.1 PAS domain S-box-containing protein [Alkalispirochaeta americana]